MSKKNTLDIDYLHDMFSNQTKYNSRGSGKTTKWCSIVIGEALLLGYNEYIVLHQHGHKYDTTLAECLRRVSIELYGISAKMVSMNTLIIDNRIALEIMPLRFVKKRQTTNVFKVFIENERI